MNTKRFCLFLLPSLAFGVQALAETTAHGITDGTQLKARLANLPKLEPLSGDMQVSSDIQAKSSSPFGLTDAQLDEISQNVLWRRLLMFTDSPKSTKKEQSLISEPEFFISQTGQTSPKDELVAILSALEQGDGEVVCQFPARTHFLVQYLAKFDKKLAVSDAHCGEFHAWADKVDAQSLSLVFAEEHGNNLASAFAHAFMRIDSRRDDKQGKYATAMNYTVKSDSSDGALASAIKPIIGKYAGVMEILPYQVKADDYLVKDERDLWEYRLDLSDAEVEQIMRHIWEVRNLQRPYYLTHDNCATEIARLTDIVRADKSLSKQLGMVTTPAKVVQIFADNGMIEQTDYHPSNSTRRQAIINNGKSFNMASIQPNNNNPTQASPTHRLGVAVSHHDTAQDDKDGTAYHVTFRTAYQDWLDNPAGVRKFHAVTLPSVDIKYQDNAVKLHELTIFKTTSLNPTNTAKAYPNGNTDKKELASQMYLGVHEVTDASDTANDTHLVLDAHLSKGKSWAIGQGKADTGDMPNAVCYAMAGGGGQLGKVNQGYRVGVQASTGCIYHHTDKLRTTGEFVLPYWYHKDSVGRSGYVQPSLNVGVQYDISRRHALRLTGQSQRNHSQTDNAVRFELLNYF